MRELLEEFTQACQHQGVVGSTNYEPKKFVTALVKVLERVHLEGISFRVKTEKGNAVLRSLCHGNKKYHLEVPVPAVVYKPKPAPPKENLGPQTAYPGAYHLHFTICY